MLKCKRKKNQTKTVYVSCLSARTLLQASQQKQSYNLMHAELLKCLLPCHFSTASAVAPDVTIHFNNCSQWGTIAAADSANACGTGTLPRADSPRKHDPSRSHGTGMVESVFGLGREGTFPVSPAC